MCPSYFPLQTHHRSNSVRTAETFQQTNCQPKLFKWFDDSPLYLFSFKGKVTTRSRFWGGRGQRDDIFPDDSYNLLLWVGQNELQHIISGTLKEESRLLAEGPWAPPFCVIFPQVKFQIKWWLNQAQNPPPLCCQHLRVVVYPSNWQSTGPFSTRSPQIISAPSKKRNESKYLLEAIIHRRKHLQCPAFFFFHHPPASAWQVPASASIPPPNSPSSDTKKNRFYF